MAAWQLAFGPAALLIVLSAVPMAAQQPDSARSAAPAQPQDTARNPTPAISPDSARALALARVPGGTITSQELETEHGRLVYDLDVRDPKTARSHDIHVDATTGQVLKHEQDDDDD